MRSALLALLCWVVALHAADPLGPGSGPWVKESPEEHGLSSAELNKASDFIEANVATRHCFLMAKDGALIFDKYYGNRNVNSVGDGWSMTKTVGALVTGAAQQLSGLDMDAMIKATYDVNSPKSYDVTSRMIQTSAIAGASPGASWQYDTFGNMWINHMPRVVSAVTGRTAAQVWNERLRDPLAMSSGWVWLDANNWGFGTRGTCEDYLRIGQLMLNKGMWAGHGELIRKEYMEELARPYKFGGHDFYTNPCYGFLTWLNTDRTTYPGKCGSSYSDKDQYIPGLDSGAYVASGMNGQVILVDPETNTVVVSMGNGGGRGWPNTACGLAAGFCPAFGKTCCAGRRNMTRVTEDPDAALLKMMLNFTSF